jgi:hypothetical protein
MDVPLSDVNAMMSPYYTAFGETKPEGIADLISTQKDLVTAADEQRPYMDLSQLVEMGLLTPEQAAQFGYEGYAQGGITSAAPQGYYLGGTTDGMADQIPATIDNSQPAALSDGEFVVPADVVSHLGNGSSEAGSKQLYSMMDRIRKARTGRESQGKEIEPGKYMPR